MAPSLVDLSPLLRLALLGLAIAAVPLAWLAWRHRTSPWPVRVRALTLLTLFLTFDLVLFGAFTRLTDSGLGCPDWPGCYGEASPLAAHAEIREAQTAQPSGPVTFQKAWIEMIHRYLATGVGVLIIVLLALNVWRRRQDAAAHPRAYAPGWATLTLVWVCVQGAFGALTVTLKLYPLVVTLHLMGGIGLLVLLAVQAARSDGAAPWRLASGVRALAWLTTALVGVQVALGGWVSTNYAVLACQDFPTCQGQWWPPMHFGEGFTLLRHLGTARDGGYLPFEALTAIHVTHRLAAAVVLSALALLAWRLWRSDDAGARRAGAWLAGLATLQFLTGLSNIVLDWPLVAAVLHTGGAAGLMTVLATLLARSAAAPRSDPLPRAAPSTRPLTS
jgi:cytochrome c oxidase assembly protein subunit 15